MGRARCWILPLRPEGLQGGGLRSPQPSPQPQDQGRVNSTDRPSASTLIHTHWVAPRAPGYTPPHTAPSHIHTQAHTPLRCHQQVTEHTTQTTVPSAAACCDMTPRDTRSCNTYTHKTHRRPGPRYADACREQRFIATPGNTGSHARPQKSPKPCVCNTPDLHMVDIQEMLLAWGTRHFPSVIQDT